MYTHQTMQAFHDSIIKLVEKEVDLARLSLRPSDVEWMNGLLSLIRTISYPRPLSAPAGQIRISGETLDRAARAILARSEEHTSELQSLMRISYAVFCLKKKKHTNTNHNYKHEDRTRTVESVK